MAETRTQYMTSQSLPHIPPVFVQIRLPVFDADHQTVVAFPLDQQLQFTLHVMDCCGLYLPTLELAGVCGPGSM